MAIYDEPDFQIIEYMGRAGIACQHLRDDNQARMFEGCYMMYLPGKTWKMYFCPACATRGDDELIQLVAAYVENTFVLRATD